MKLTYFIGIAILIIIGCDNKTEIQKPKRLSFEILKPNVIPNFDSLPAFAYVQKQLSFGPRNPNSLGHRQAMNYLFEELKKSADTAFIQKFNYPGYDEQLELGNIIASFNPKAEGRILLCAHWDTRPRAEKDKIKSELPILGANDGASGVAILLELAKIIKANKINFGVDIVLFDGEDYGKEGDLMNYSLGAKYFAQNKPQYVNQTFAILLDMVGDKNALFKREPNSMRFAPDIVDMVWRMAFEIGVNNFSDELSNPIYDDHIPLNEVGIKTIDIIDADLVGADSPNEKRNYWHTHNDTIDKISPHTLGEVGRLLVHFIYSLKFTTSD